MKHPVKHQESVVAYWFCLVLLCILSLEARCWTCKVTNTSESKNIGKTARPWSKCLRALTALFTSNHQGLFGGVGRCCLHQQFCGRHRRRFLRGWMGDAVKRFERIIQKLQGAKQCNFGLQTVLALADTLMIFVHLRFLIWLDQLVWFCSLDAAKRGSRWGGG